MSVFDSNLQWGRPFNAICICVYTKTKYNKTSNWCESHMILQYYIRLVKIRLSRPVNFWMWGLSLDQYIYICWYELFIIHFIVVAPAACYCSFYFKCRSMLHRTVIMCAYVGMGSVCVCVLFPSNTADYIIQLLQVFILLYGCIVHFLLNFSFV